MDKKDLEELEKLEELAEGLFSAPSETIKKIKEKKPQPEPDRKVDILPTA